MAKTRHFIFCLIHYFMYFCISRIIDMNPMNIIGRKREQKILASIVKSGRPEFVVVYGRRRVGKTFLINSYFKERFAFKFTGLAKKDMKLQLKRFGDELRRQGFRDITTPRSWFEAFDCLRDFLEKTKRAKSRQVVFIDELPFMDSQRSNLVPALENFWNSWGCTQSQLILIICGSATTWITHKIIKNHGGLHNRLTVKMNLHPFSLFETRQHLRAMKVDFSQRDIMECYMIMGGIPYYQSLLQSGLSLAQNVDNLFFNKDGRLVDEFDNLYASLFDSSDKYIRIIEALSKKSKGLTREEIQEETGLTSGGVLTKCLENLVSCDLIRSYPGYGKTQRRTMYQLIDFYTLFYYKFIHKHTQTSSGYWIHLQGTSKHSVWSGYAFEQLCLAHYPQIAKSLGISGIMSEIYAWRSNQKDGGAQIDLVIKRSDHVVNVCEIKYWREPFRLTQKYINELQNKIEVFRRENNVTQAIHLVMITSNGLANPAFSSVVQREVKAENLFEDAY